ncbi:unnamed protein product [Oikopleura dioica]|uniref:Uncharacterized protein n=1 Tax=Oikopleura dioica TaxID=34765 RepID=E4XLX4_OIKDI|nr:unnamed protein product [Oikopleura dioica]CBY10983.1 unnamed protein product [Oikopleura dioica]
MKIFSLFFAFALAQDDSERGKNDADEKGAQMCQGVKADPDFFACKHKKNGNEGPKRKKCKSLCDKPKVKKIYCNEDGWGSKNGNKVNVNNIC